MPAIIKIDNCSRLAVRLTAYRDDLPLAYGSGFLWRLQDRIAVVTAWHCVTGAHPHTKQPLSPETAGRPNKLGVALLRHDFGSTEVLLDLYDEDGDPVWYIHPAGFAEIDLAAIFFSPPSWDGIISLYVNDVPDMPMALRVGADLFILGFPRNLDRLGLPIWKRASLAIDVEAAIDQPGHRHYLVDTASREGMSGALVIARSNGGYQHENGMMMWTGADATRIMGVYTGRVGTKDELAAQIGIVWPIRYVEELIANPTLDDFS